MLATIQQLQESGLLGQLPSLLSAVAACLTAAQSGLPDAPRATKHRVVVSPTCAAQVAVLFRDWASCLVQTGGWLHNMTQELRQPDVSGRKQDCPEVFSSDYALALADLVLALARDISGNLGPTDSPSCAMWAPLVSACDQMQWLWCLHVRHLVPHCKELRHDAHLKPEVQQVLLSPSLVPSLALVLAAVAHTWPAERRQRRTAQAEGSSGGNGPYSRLDATSSAAVKLAWQ